MTFETIHQVLDEIIREADRGYHNRDDYPPYAIASWDDRNRYRDYILKIIEEIKIIVPNSKLDKI